MQVFLDTRHQIGDKQTRALACGMCGWIINYSSSKERLIERLHFPRQDIREVVLIIKLYYNWSIIIWSADRLARLHGQFWQNQNIRGELLPIDDRFSYPHRFIVIRQLSVPMTLVIEYRASAVLLAAYYTFDSRIESSNLKRVNWTVELNYSEATRTTEYQTNNPNFFED